MYVPRLLDLKQITDQKSCFLFGPRQTGKSSLIQHQLPDATVIDLLDDEIYLRLQQNAKALSGLISAPERIVVIDEIQRIPNLLNEVHRLIEKQRIKFLLTGSSARKLRRKGVNLLGGRARSRVLHPLVSAELATAVRGGLDFSKALSIGTIPSIYFSSDPWDDLSAYVTNYLQEEIIAEAATRNIPGFARFLEVAAVCNGMMINYEKVANDAQVPRSTVQAYFQILRDTLLGKDLPAFRKTRSRKAIGTSKFYLFDLGVVNALRRVKAVQKNTSDYGYALEAFIFHELSSYCDYQTGHALHYWRSKSGLEVDFMIDESIAIEVKSTTNASQEDLKGLRALNEERKLRKQILVCQEPIPKKQGSIEVLPIQLFLEKLWAKEIVD